MITSATEKVARPQPDGGLDHDCQSRVNLTVLLWLSSSAVERNAHLILGGLLYDVTRRSDWIGSLQQNVADVL